MIDMYIAAYRQYCWPVTSLSDLKLAPFHLLATEGAVHVDKDHIWHMEALKKICDAAPGILLATPYKTVDLVDPQSQANGDGMVGGPHGQGRGRHCREAPPVCDEGQPWSGPASC
jgi:hypothetical protein